jgi:predicted nucleic acid-binding protein
VIYDTNFLVAIQGRKKGFTRAEAIAWMKREDAGGAYVPRIVEIEFLGGFAADDDAAAHLHYFTVLPMDEAVLKEAVQVMRELRSTGQGVGAADSIIAATARLYGLPLVTDNIRHFKPIKGLDVRGFMK